MGYNENKQQLLESLEQQSSALSDILELNGFSLITDDEWAKLRELKSETDTIYRKLKNNEFEIAVVGMEKAGKSSFCNALIGNALLPAKQARCTYTSTRLMYGCEDRGEVGFYSEEEFNTLLQGKLQKLGIPNANTYTLLSLTEDKFNELYDENVSDEAKKAYGSSLVTEIRDTIEHSDLIAKQLGQAPLPFQGDALKSEAFQKYIESPGYAMAAKYVRIQSSALDNMQNAVIFDVPGFNSPTEEHQRQTRERMKDADAIVVVASAPSPSLVKEQLNVFKEHDADGIRFSEKLFVFANKADGSDLADSIHETYKEWGKKHSILSNQDRFFFGAANAHLQAMGQLNDTIDYVDGMERALNGALDTYKEECGRASAANGYGVKALRTALEAYNKTERLRVLEERTGRLRQQLWDIMENLRRRTPEANNSASRMSYVVEGKKFGGSFGEKLEQVLNKYRSQLVQTIHADKLLSRKLVEYITENIVPDLYERDIEDTLAHAKAGVNIVTDNQNALISQSQIEDAIRAQVFHRMYEDGFAKETATAMTSELYDEIVNNVLELCLEAMDVATDSAYYDSLKADLYENLRANGLLDIEAAQDYFQSLVDRYSRDLFELLIGQRYEVERYERFWPDMPMFFSMAVYYDPDTEPMEMPAVGKIIGTSLRDNTFCYQMLCHDYAVDSDEKRRTVVEIESNMKSRLHTKELAAAIPDLIQKLVTATLGGATKIAADIVEEAVSLYDSDLDRFGHIRKALRDRLKEASGLACVDVANREEFKPVYNRCFKLTRTEEDLKNDLRVDIDILRHVLLYCFVRALHPEKPFVTRVVNMIGNIKNYLKSDAADTYFGPRMRLIRSSTFHNIEEQELEQERNLALRKSIDEILSGVFGQGEIPE